MSNLYVCCSTCNDFVALLQSFCRRYSCISEIPFCFVFLHFMRCSEMRVKFMKSNSISLLLFLSFFLLLFLSFCLSLFLPFSLCYLLYLPCPFPENHNRRTANCLGIDCCQLKIKRQLNQICLE